MKFVTPRNVEAYVRFRRLDLPDLFSNRTLVYLLGKKVLFATQLSYYLMRKFMKNILNGLYIVRFRWLDLPDLLANHSTENRLCLASLPACPSRPFWLFSAFVGPLWPFEEFLPNCLGIWNKEAFLRKERCHPGGVDPSLQWRR
jgi:hypothetical protein